MVDEVEDMGLTVPEDVEEVMETLIEEVVEPTPVEPKLSGSIKEQLTALVGEDGVSTLEEVAKSTYKDLDEFAKITVIDTALDSLEIFTGKNRSPLNMVALDADGNIIDLDDAGMELADKGYEGFSLDSVFETTVFEPGFSPENMGTALKEVFRAKLTLGDWEAKQKTHTELLDPVRKAMTQLGEVFGFDNYEHLEMFFAAWLMKDSTCRLSGIPGTGKTTVIESAAVLLCNSYGFNKQSRFVAPIRADPYTMEELFGDNRSYVAQEYPSGMEYNLTYSNSAYETVRNDWDEWRFTSWSRPGGRNRSGAYLYDMSFLHPSGKRDGEPFQKKALEIGNFYKLLNNCYVVQAPVQGFTDPSEGKSEGKELLKQLDEDQIQTVVAPIKLLNADGTLADFGTPLVYDVYDVRGNKHQFPMQIRFPDVNMAAETENTQNYKWILEQGDATEFIQGGYGLFTDAGRSEGYGFRQYLIENFVDLRSKDARISGKWKPILEEMLEEIGVAKIDYEKRADEVLYGIEIQQSTVTDKIRDAQISTYEFEPVPRPIVTQPIKFFNEANRSQSGVEDAVLGLIAEKLVEYRGKTFKSPDFVAWMDTNPHQKGNDLAFTDRIDMELLFKSVSLGGRYDQLVNKFSGKGGLEPNQILVEYMKLDEADPNSFKPMRIGNLFGVWKMVGKETKFTSPGSSYDGFRDISVISVLFSQIFAKRPETVNVGGSDQGVRYSFADIDDAQSLDLYESPLLDYSTTTNTNTSDRGTTSPVLNDDTMIFGNADVAGQLPTVFTRVLGFRFTNSIVKLAQAFAFLRGKESVSRQEILDAVPYAIAHRMGRAKAGAKDMEGNNKGLDGNRIGYVNEQEFVREMVVKGYLEGKVDGVDMDEQNLMDNADYYYNHCRSIMDSVPFVWEYEELILRPLYQAINDRDVDDMTPIHWHIATMVIEEERKGRGRKVARNYASSMAGPKGSPAIQKAPTNYHEMYSNYESLILNPSPNGEPCLWDYYRLRGFIAREANLFTNDRDRLLKMLEGEVRIIAGADGLEVDIDLGSVNVRPFPQGITPLGADGNLMQTTYRAVGEGPWPRPEQTYWHTYDDAQGTFGSLIGMGQVETYDLNQSSTPLTIDSSFTRAAANQSLRITGRYQQTANLNQSISRYDISKTLNQFAKNFRTSIGAGLNLGPSFPEKSDSAIAMSFDDWIKKAQAFLISKISDPTRDPENDLWGCFELNHAPVVTPQMGLRGVKGNDKLRLWLRLSMIGQSQSASGGDLIDMLFTVGITSAPALTAKANVGLDAEGPDFEILEVSNTKQYASKQWMNGSSQQGFKSNTALVDSGNMLALDRLYYNKLFANSLE